MDRIRKFTKQRAIKYIWANKMLLITLLQFVLHAQGACQSPPIHFRPTQKSNCAFDSPKQLAEKLDILYDITCFAYYNVTYNGMCCSHISYL